MGKLTVAVLALGMGFAGLSWAQADNPDCQKVKSAIEEKIRKNGVEKFALDVVEKDAQADGKVVGTCGGKYKIVYKRD